MVLDNPLLFSRRNFSGEKNSLANERFRSVAATSCEEKSSIDLYRYQNPASLDNTREGAWGLQLSLGRHNIGRLNQTLKSTLTPGCSLNSCISSHPLWLGAISPLELSNLILFHIVQEVEHMGIFSLVLVSHGCIPLISCVRNWAWKYPRNLFCSSIWWLSHSTVPPSNLLPSCNAAWELTWDVPRVPCQYTWRQSHQWWVRTIWALFYVWRVPVYVWPRSSRVPLFFPYCMLQNKW